MLFCWSPCSGSRTPRLKCQRQYLFNRFFLHTFAYKWEKRNKFQWGNIRRRRWSSRGSWRPGIFISWKEKKRNLVCQSTSKAGRIWYTLTNGGRRWFTTFNIVCTASEEIRAGKIKLSDKIILKKNELKWRATLSNIKIDINKGQSDWLSPPSPHGVTCLWFRADWAHPTK